MKTIARPMDRNPVRDRWRWAVMLPLLTLSVSPPALSASPDSEAARTKPGGAEPEAAEPVVTMSNQPPFYDPAVLTVRVGDSVHWINDHNSETHTARALDGAFLSPDVAPADDWCHRFDHEGEFVYACRYHPWMRGRVVVEPRRLASVAQPLPEGMDRAIPVRPLQGAIWWLAPPLVLAPGASTPLPLPRRADLSPEGCAVHGDDLWCTAGADGEVVRYRVAGGDVAARAYAVPGGTPTLLTVDAAGTPWFFDAAAARLSRLDPRSGRTESAPVTLPARPVELVAASDGSLWIVTETRRTLARWRQGEPRAETWELPPGSVLDRPIPGAAGEAWVADRGRGKVMRVGDEWIREFTVPGAAGRTIDLAVHEGSVWLAVEGWERLGVLRDGRVEGLATEPMPERVVFDADGSLWIDAGERRRVAPEEVGRLAAAAAKVCPPNPAAMPFRPVPTSGPSTPERKGGHHGPGSH